MKVLEEIMSDRDEEEEGRRKSWEEYKKLCKEVREIYVAVRMEDMKRLTSSEDQS